MSQCFPQRCRGTRGEIWKEFTFAANAFNCMARTRKNVKCHVARTTRTIDGAKQGESAAMAVLRTAISPRA